MRSAAGTTRGAPIALRVVLTCVGAVVLAVGIELALSVVLDTRTVNQMVQERRDDLAASLRATAAAAYNTGKPGWSKTDLAPALELADRSGADVTVLDTTGRSIASTINGVTASSAAPLRDDVVVAGRRVGTIVVRFNDRGLVPSADRLRSSLDEAMIGAAGFATLVAMVAALALSHRLTSPLTRLTAVVRSMSGGDRQARVGPVPHAPQEIQELAGAFDGMADTLAQQETARRNLVSDLAHELRTPVAILQANTEALLDGVVAHTPEQTASLHEEVLRLGSLIDDLRSLANADAAVLHLEPEPCDLAEVVAGALDAASPSLAVAGLEVTRRLEPAVVLGDRGRLHQVVANLIGNAAKFTPHGGRIDVAVAAADGVAELRVADTGMGIAADDLPHVFERFRRGANAGRAQGSGIGLAVVAELVRAHHGSIDIDSEPGCGTTVRLTFPLAVPIAS